MTFDNLIEYLGSSVTLKTVTLPGANTPDTETYSDSTVKMILMPVNEKIKQLSDGRLQDGDMVGYIKTTQAIKERDIVVWNSINWEVVSTNKMPYLDAVQYIRVGLKKQ